MTAFRPSAQHSSCFCCSQLRAQLSAVCYNQARSWLFKATHMRCAAHRPNSVPTAREGHGCTPGSALTQTCSVTHTATMHAPRVAHHRAVAVVWKHAQMLTQAVAHTKMCSPHARHSHMHTAHMSAAASNARGHQRPPPTRKPVCMQACSAACCGHLTPPPAPPTQRHTWLQHRTHLLATARTHARSDASRTTTTSASNRAARSTPCKQAAQQAQTTNTRISPARGPAAPATICWCGTLGKAGTQRRPAHTHSPATTQTKDALAAALTICTRAARAAAVLLLPLPSRQAGP